MEGNWTKNRWVSDDQWSPLVTAQLFPLETSRCHHNETPPIATTSFSSKDSDWSSYILTKANQMDQISNLKSHQFSCL